MLAPGHQVVNIFHLGWGWFIPAKQLRKYASNTIIQVLQFSSVQSLSRVRLFSNPRSAARQASLSITNSRSLLKLITIKSVMPSNHLILYCPLLLLPSIFPSIRVFPMSQFFASGGQSIGASASFREELKQRIWGKVYPGKAPLRSCLVTF